MGKSSVRSNKVGLKNYQKWKQVSVSRLMRGVRQKRLFRCAIAFWLKLNSSAFFQLCRHLWAKCFSPVSNFSLANAEFREIFSHFR